MFKGLWLLLVCFIPLAVAQSNVTDSTLMLMPWPQKVEQHKGHVLVRQPLKLSIIGPISERLKRNIANTTEKLNRRLVHKEAKTSDKELRQTLQIRVNHILDKTADVLGIDESYQLITNTKGVSLTANTDVGIMHGLQTLLQLMGNAIDGELRLPIVTIEDAPRFKWRGLLLDPARHFLPVDTIKRQIDGMASAKLNALHWHLTDDQGWRIESKRYPRLHQMASDGEFYSQQDIRDIVAYAWYKGIRVIPEVDIPGHASAIAVAYPELIALPGEYPMQREWGVHKPTLNPINEQVYQFVDELVAELSEIFPDPYFHIGGDEVAPEQWRQNPQIQAFIKKHKLTDYRGMQAHFNVRINSILQKHHKKMIGWDEIYHPDLPENILIQSWRGHDSINHKSKNGRRSILSTGFYVDQPQSTAYHYRNDPIPKVTPVSTKPKADESWHRWDFAVTRVKGNPVTGSFTLFSTSQGYIRGFIDFDSRSRKTLTHLTQLGTKIRFSVDTWMGPFTATLDLSSDRFDGTVLVANGPYPMQGKKVAGSDLPGTLMSEGIVLTPLTSKEQSLVLGGEATLWGELVTAELVDLRLWPRTYAIAERLWSASTLTDEQFMYQRLRKVAVWAQDTVGLQHFQQANSGMKRIMGFHDITPLQILAEAVEQPQYYHRHHAKYQQGEYHQSAPLNRFVDTLPVESTQVRHLHIWVKQWLTDPSDKVLFNKIQKLLRRWNNNAEQLKRLLNTAPELNEIAPVVQQVAEVSKMGLHLLSLIAHQRQLSQQEYQQLSEMLQDAMTIRQEIVVSSAHSVETLLFHLAP